ncbi:hypothetical protein QUB63_11505 [Microcoleus sp. ARI1-B5]|uniref:hypothetical protein n=1 Tax=unclassified Microcoleus TaxID=2642155 RepID=UPI002FD77353
MYPQKTEENSRYFTTQEFEETLTAARQVMKLSIVVPGAIDERENWRSFVNRF